MRTFKVVVLGSGSVGKSAITLRFIHGRFVEQVRHFAVVVRGVCFFDLRLALGCLRGSLILPYRHQVEVDGVNYILEILDTAGTEQFAQLRNLYVKNGMGFVLVFSLASKSSFLEISELREQIVRVKESTTVPMVIVGNKSDLEDLRQVSRKEAEQLCRNFNCEFIESSAKNNTNIDQIFHTLIRIITAQEKPKKKDQAKLKCILL